VLQLERSVAALLMSVLVETFNGFILDYLPYSS